MLNAGRNGIKISVITACLNPGPSLRSTVESVLSQGDGLSLEYIVVDGGSSDGTLDILKSYGGRIARWLSERDNGIAEAWNKGIRLATGDVVGFLNSGDWYEPCALRSVVETFQEHPEYDIVYGHIRVWHDKAGRRPLVRLAPRAPDCLKAYMCLSHPACFAKRRVFEEIGLFETQYRIAADYDWLLRAYLAGVKFGRVDGIVTNYRLGGLSDRRAWRAYVEAWEISRKYGAPLVPSALGLCTRLFKLLVRRGMEGAGLGMVVDGIRRRTSQWS